MTKHPRRIFSALLIAALIVSAGCSNSANVPQDGGTQEGDAASSNSTSGSPASANSSDKMTIAFVTNQIATFWNIAESGCETAGKDLDVDVIVRMPEQATAVKQKQIVEDLLSSGVSAIAISPVDADNQIGLINQWAEAVPLITQDSDAPNTNRLMYIGMDNYLAGRMVGELVKKALPNGGEVLLTIGRLEQDNSKRRRQGVLDVLLDRPEMTEYDPTGDVLKGNGFTILATLTDQGDESIAKRKAEDAITTYPELDAFVGLFNYNPPACLQAIKSQGKDGKIAVIGFDEADQTLQGIKDGTVVGTVVQNPFQYGYQSVQILKSILEGDNSVIPESKFINIPARTITKENVDEFWDELKTLTGG